MAKRKKDFCVFCKRSDDICGPLVSSPDSVDFPKVNICGSCSKECSKVIQQQVSLNRQRQSYRFVIPSAKEIYNDLNLHVIGQDEAKKTLSVEVHSHYQRIMSQDDHDDGVQIEKSNILLIGPSGSGKTHLVQTLAKKLDVPFAIGDATTLTEAGYVGEDVENLLLKLIQAADWDIARAESGIIFIDEIDKIRKTGGNTSITRDVSGEGVQQSLLKLIEGTVSNVPPNGGRKHPEAEYLQINTSNILFICGGAFTGLDRIIKKRTNKNRIGFGTEQNLNNQAEVDKLILEVCSDDLIEFGLIPEFIGRLPVVSTLNGITYEDMVRILVEPQNAILKQEMKKVLLKNGVLIFTDEAISEIAKIAIEMNTGARALRSVISKFMRDIYFEMPADCKGEFYEIDKDVVLRKKKLSFKKVA